MCYQHLQNKNPLSIWKAVIIFFNFVDDRDVPIIITHAMKLHSYEIIDRPPTTFLLLNT